MRLGRRRDRDLDDLERRIVWLLGSPRSGTTWVLNLLARRPEVVKIDEPNLGTHLGVFLHEVVGVPARVLAPGQSLVTEVRGDNGDYFFATEYSDVWRPQLRRLILTRFAAQLDRAGKPDALPVIKEPNGSQAAGMLFEACPGSRLLWLMRDGRDVVESKVDAAASGGWGAFEKWEMTEGERLRFVEDRAYRWLRRTELLQQVYDRLPDEQRLIVRYEEARQAAPQELERMLRWLGVPVTAEDATRDAEALACARVPAEQRGPGKFGRAGRSGGWRESLTAAEQEVMDRVMGPKLRELGYA
jgi:hypothetical protein